MTISLLIFFYTFSTSIIFVYGIGLDRLCINVRSYQSLLQFVGQNIIVMLCSASFLWILERYLSLFIGLFFIVPIMIALIVYIFEYLFQRFIFKGKYKKREERLFVYGTIYFALYNAVTYLELLIIIISACTSMIVWTYILHSVILRIEDTTVQRQWRNTPLLLISMGIITLALYSWDSIWIM